MKELVSRLAIEFSDKEYAHSYMEGHLVDRIAAQIYNLRKQRGWSQKELAERAGMSQEKISKYESADFDSLTLKTLWKFCKAFDVNLHVAFDSFSAGINDVVNLNVDALQVKSREEDLQKFNLEITNELIKNLIIDFPVECKGNPHTNALVINYAFTTGPLCVGEVLHRLNDDGFNTDYQRLTGVSVRSGSSQNTQRALCRG